MTAPQEVVAEPRNRVAVLAAGGLAVVLLLFVASKVFMGGGDDEATPIRPNVNRPATTATTTAAAAPAAPAEAAPVETFEVFNTKNPFMPLRGATTAAAKPPSAPVTQTVTPSPVATPVAVTTPGAVATVVTVAPAPVQAGATGGQATAPVQSTRVALLDVFTEGDRVVANVRVNDTVSKVGAGDTFASNFKVVSLDAAERCGRFLFGDDQFRLCRGEELLK